MRRYLVLILTLLILSSVNATAQKSLQKLWETDTIFPVPESIYHAAKEDIFYVSLIDGKSADADGKGGVGKVSKQGSIIDLDWNTSLDAPKGMAMWNDKLYVADLKSLAVLDYNSGKLIKKITIDSVGMFNDVTTDDKGTIYVSDSKAGKIYRFVNDTASIFVDMLVNPNGILWHDNHLYFLDSGVLYRTSNGIEQNVVAKGMAKDTDGLQYYGDNNFIASAWSGVVYFIEGNGAVKELMNTQQEKMNTADFYYNAQAKIIYVPTFYRKTIAAYELK